MMMYLYADFIITVKNADKLTMQLQRMISSFLLKNNELVKVIRAQQPQHGCTY